MRPLITVVGGAITDIFGAPAGAFVPRDSNPGQVSMSSGGVGRNIAENLARLGARVRLVTAFGDDAESERLAAECEQLGIDTSFAVRVAGTPGSRYLAILDETGDMVAAVSDLRALEHITRAAENAAAYAGADAVVIDSNLAPEAIETVVALVGAAPIVLDPVSSTKAPRARGVLGKLSVVKGNLIEAEALAGAPGAEAAAERLLELGVERVFITMSTDGVYCASADERFTVPAPRVTVANATGAGDAFTAGVAWAVATGMSLRQTAEWASSLSALALESERTVSERISPALFDE